MKKSLDLESLFCEVSRKFLSEHDCFKTRGELGVFSHASVIWLGIQQRLSGNTLQASLTTLVERIREDTSPLNLVTRPGKKIRQNEVTLNTGGISRARERLQESLVEQLFDAATDNIANKLSGIGSVYLLDGQIVTVARTESILKKLGKTGNGEGELHFPRIRVVAVHSLETGIAKQLAIGTWHDSEAKLGAEVLKSLPKKSIVVMDRYFDKPTFLAQAHELQIGYVARVREVVARRLFGKIPRKGNAEREVVWVPADKDKAHIQLKGRIIKFTAEASGFRSSEFYFFTNVSELSLEQAAALYRKRVNIEIFIRQLKQTLKLFFVRAKKAENVRKEIYLAYLTFNLLRAIMHLAAQEAGVEPERMSFTATLTLCNTYASAFLRARSNTERAELFKKFAQHMKQAKIPQRKKERSYPRVIKLPRDRYPKRGIVKVYSEDEGK